MRSSFFVAAVLVGFHSSFAQTVQVLETRADGSVLLGHHQIAFGNQALGAGTVTIAIDESMSFQKMDGFGASLTDSSAALLMQLPPDQRKQLMQELFDPAGPLGLTLLRQPIGASDFSAHGNYSYDDPPESKPDPSLAHFNTAIDAHTLFPLLREALHLNPQLRFVILPWSAPAWMKDSHAMNSGSLLSSDIPVYAQYLSRAVESYAAEGLPVYAMALQNEPLNENPSYPTQHMGPDQEAQLAAALRPLLWHDGRDPLLLGYEHNWDNLDYPSKLLADAAQLVPKGTPPLFAGISFHCYAGDESAQLAFLRAHPEAGIWFTECSGTNRSLFADDLLWQAHHLLLGAPLNEARSVLLWNLVLDPHGSPRNGGCGDCRALITVEPHDGGWSVHRNVEYYELAHAAPFIHPEALRIAAKVEAGHDLQTVAFKNLDGTVVLLVLNSAPREMHTTIQWQGKAAVYTAPPRSLITLQWGIPHPVLSEGTFRIAADATGQHCLGATAGGHAPELGACSAEPVARFLWNFHRLSEGRFEVRNVATAQSLAIGPKGELATLTLDGDHIAPLGLSQQANGFCLLGKIGGACTTLAPNANALQAGTLLHLEPASAPGNQ